jgi:sugar/nucleoside kinase (ribokinase family)
MSFCDLLCAGHVTLDRYGDELHPGGCVTYAALTFSALGGKAALLSRAGEEFPRNFFAPLVAAEILPAGFLYAILQGSGLEEAARLGAACASIIIEGTAYRQAWRIAREARARAECIRG